MALTLSEVYAFHYQLNADPSGVLDLSPKGKQSLAKGHKLVVATASISGYDEHKPIAESTGTAVAGGDAHSHLYVGQIPGKAVALFEKYLQNGASKTANTPLVMGDNITEITWNFHVEHCWARAVFTIMAFD